MNIETRKEQIEQYHIRLFEWHCKNFFPFTDHFTGCEMNYLKTCFALTENFVEASDLGYGNFSYYSYSHRVDNDRVNSSRLAFGSVLHPEECFAVAAPVIAERKLSVDELFPQHSEHRFYGLGWDIAEGHFKIYWRVPDVHKIAAPFNKLVAQRSTCVMSEGLLAVTIKGNEIFERKVYLYPGGNRVEMLASNRGLVEQYDVEESYSWIGRINKFGIEIINKYNEVYERLDTISIVDKDHYTIYFP